jgi:hypothetical protein
METLILNNGNPKDLQLLLEIAEKLGLNLTVKKENRYEELLKLASKLDNSIAPNDITMEEIVEELRLVREERPDYGTENNS